MSSKKKKARDKDEMDLSQDEAFDAIMALNSASSSQASTTSGNTGSGVSTTSNSQTSSSSKGIRRKGVGSLEDNGRKNTKAAERLAKKQKKEEEKEAKAAKVEKNKIYKPGECMKYMKIEVHPSLSSAWFMSDLSREACQAGCRLSPATDLCDHNLIMWTRGVPPSITVANNQLGLNTKEQCDRALYILVADEVAEKVAGRELSQHVATIRDMSGCRLTLVVFGAQDYFKTSKRKTQNSSRKLMTDIELEMAITDLLVSAECDTVLVDTPNELALLIVQFTKAIAEAPHKLAKRSLDEQAQFYMRGDNKKCVRVDADGNGLSGLWQQMVAILPNSSLETSRAVCAQYKSPLELYEALQVPSGVTSLADMPIARSAVANSRSRRLGPEFARRMRTLFTAGDGDVVIE